MQFDVHCPLAVVPIRKPKPTWNAMLALSTLPPAHLGGHEGEAPRHLRLALHVLEHRAHFRIGQDFAHFLDQALHLPRRRSWPVLSIVAWPLPVAV